MVEQLFKVANEKLDRLALEAIAHLSLTFEHGARASPERAVVQVNHLRIERPKPRAAGRAVQRLVMSSWHGGRAAGVFAFIPFKQGKSHAKPAKDTKDEK
jgi:hypothetical protein